MQVKIDEADAKFSDLLAAARRGEEVVLTEDDKPVARHNRASRTLIGIPSLMRTSMAPLQ